MALNVGLSASARIELLDSLLRHDRWWTKEELLHEVCTYTRALKDCDVSDATLRNDLEEIRINAGEQFLEGKKGRKKTFRYQSRDFSIYNIQRPDPEDYDYLQQAIRILEQVKGFAISEELKSLLIKLKHVMPVHNKRPAIIFDGPERFDGMDILQDVYEAINKEQVVAFQYQPFSAPEALAVLLHPYILKQYNNRWYIVGFEHDIKEVRIYPLDRFKSSPKPRPRIDFISPETIGFEPLSHFEQVIGVTVEKNTPTEEIHLKFSPGRAPYIFTKPLHKSQHLLHRFEDGSILVGLQVKINKELIGLLLGFGSDIEVLKPKSLRTHVRDIARIIVRNNDQASAKHTHHNQPAPIEQHRI